MVVSHADDVRTVGAVVAKERTDAVLAVCGSTLRYACVDERTERRQQVEAFNFYNWVQWLSSIGGSALLTIILILVIENFRSKR